MNVRILLTYKRLKDADLPFFAFYVVINMKDNPYFADPQPSLATISESAKTFQRLLVASLDGGKTATRLKNQQREQLEQELLTLAGYVQSQSGFDIAKLSSSGFDVSKARKSSKVHSLVIKTGEKEGQVTSISPRVVKAKAYIHQYTTLPVTDESTWTEYVSANRKHLFTGLVPGKTYAFRVRVISVRNKQTDFNMVVKMVV
jgi:hypothetical protein